MSAERTHPFPGNLLQHVQGLGEGDSNDVDGPEQADREIRTVTDDLQHAMLLTSDTGRTTHTRYDADGRHDLGEPLHRPVLDLDLPVILLPSSTPGHHHLLIDRPMSWTQYVALLDALVAAGLVEEGCVAAAKRRGHTGVRVPWLRKGDPAPPPPPGAKLLPPRCPRCDDVIDDDVDLVATDGLCPGCAADDAEHLAVPLGAVAF